MSAGPFPGASLLMCSPSVTFNCGLWCLLETVFLPDSLTPVRPQDLASPFPAWHLEERVDPYWAHYSFFTFSPLFGSSTCCSLDKLSHVLKTIIFIFLCILSSFSNLARQETWSDNKLFHLSQKIMS